MRAPVVSTWAGWGWLFLGALIGQLALHFIKPHLPTTQIEYSKTSPRGYDSLSVEVGPR